ncbi:cytochrome P450 [Trametes coccinea BRFM310]|uniref:Cytochrome P450 n=1 Tax=Trametes coccinea (strain BRFM310) TaxID=1353009 RepID=A0A1Y2IA87_TRAC3|nr:cytochrome P450 [Trametes coccinea BRFM310]
MLLQIVQAAGIFLLSVSIHRLFFATLASIPGPKICALTRLPLMYHEFTGKRRMWIHRLHLRYGPIVRVAPDEVSFATREAAKEIYTSGGSGFDKSRFYDLFSNFETPNMFSTLERGKHAETKKRFAERYNKVHIMRPEVFSVVQEHAEAFAGKCAERIGESVDIYALLHCYALDGVTGHLFYPHGTHSLTDAEDLKIMKELSYANGLTKQFFQHYCPRLAAIVKKIAGLRERRTDGLATRYVLDTTRNATVAPHTVLHKLRTYVQDEGDYKVAASECMDHLVAGIDTTGDGLCFLMYQLSLPAYHHVQQHLHTELAANPATPLDDLPYLDAVVKEGLRVFSPIPMGFPRVVPVGGKSVDGVWLPGGTVVSCQPHTLHRLDTAVFPLAEEFRPERWLQDDGAAERNQLFFAFSAGGRGCVGKNLALLEMKLLLKEVYSTYRTRVAPDMDASMEMDDQTISSRPKGQKCLVVFERVSED